MSLLPFETQTLPEQRTAVAPDGSEVRVLLRITDRGSMAHFRLEPGQVSKRVTHRTVDEIWYILSGSGQLWRWQFGDEPEGTTVDLAPGICVTIPVGTHFQFCARGTSRLDILGITMPGWPMDREEAVRTEDFWPPQL